MARDTRTIWFLATCAARVVVAALMFSFVIFNDRFTPTKSTVHRLHSYLANARTRDGARLNSNSNKRRTPHNKNVNQGADDKDDQQGSTQQQRVCVAPTLMVLTVTQGNTAAARLVSTSRLIHMIRLKPHVSRAVVLAESLSFSELLEQLSPLAGGGRLQAQSIVVFPLVRSRSCSPSLLTSSSSLRSCSSLTPSLFLFPFLS